MSVARSAGQHQCAIIIGRQIKALATGPSASHIVSIETGMRLWRPPDSDAMFRVFILASQTLRHSRLTHSTNSESCLGRTSQVGLTEHREQKYARWQQHEFTKTLISMCPTEIACEMRSSRLHMHSSHPPYPPHQSETRVAKASARYC